MIDVAELQYPKDQLEYFGFDLFEDLTEEDLRNEFSKRPPDYEVVRRNLERTGADIHLYKGNTKVTLPRAVSQIGYADLVFVDGGHSIETITADWSSVKQIMGQKTIVLFDDYYLNSQPHIQRVGCQSLVDALDRKVYDVDILQPTDSFTVEWGILKINMARVRMRACH